MSENAQKKAARDARIAEATATARAARKTEAHKNKQRVQQRIVSIRKAEAQAAQDLVNARREARANGSIYVDAEPRVALVVRIKGIHHHAPRVRKILQLFRLRQINNATFVKLNKATLNMLQQVGYCVAWGYATPETVRKLVYAKGFGKVNGQRIPLTNNEIVQQALGNVGDKGVMCLEDIVHEIVTCGPNFKQVNNFLWPFKLSSQRGGMRRKNHSFINGGDWGNRECYINQMVARQMSKRR